MSNAPAWLQHTTTGIAGLALFLSALSLYLQRRDKRPRLKLRQLTAVVPPRSDLPLLQLHMANTGEKKIDVATAHFRLGGD